jgi:geranylgeranyl reductase family protein
MRLDCDVIIAGAGPAGAATAIHLASCGISVIVVESEAFPRDKVCGDFVSPMALRELRALGVAALPEYRTSHIVRHAAVHVDGKHLMTSAIPKVPGLQAHGRVIPRKALDHWIAGRAVAAGAQLWENCRVDKFEIRRGHVQVGIRRAGQASTLRARMLIGADGSSSVVARVLRGRGVPPEDRIIAVRGYFEGVEGPSNRADIYFSRKIFPGYYWLFPHSKTGANVGVGMAMKTVPPNRDHLRTVLLDLVQHDPALRGRLGNARQAGDIVGWPLSTFDADLPITGDRVILVGDAAGLINPLNGEGIQYALLSARWAADAVKYAVERGLFSQEGFHPYAARVAVEWQYDMAVARMILQLIRNRSLTKVWLEAVTIIAAGAREDSAYAAITGGVLAGLIPVHRVLGLDVILKTAKQAARSLAGETLQAVVRGPGNVANRMAAVTGIAAEMGMMIVQNRDESVRWGVDLAQSAKQLAGEFLIDAAAATKRTRGATKRPSRSAG